MGAAAARPPSTTAVPPAFARVALERAFPVVDAPASPPAVSAAAGAAAAMPLAGVPLDTVPPVVPAPTMLHAASQSPTLPPGMLNDVNHRHWLKLADSVGSRIDIIELERESTRLRERQAAVSDTPLDHEAMLDVVKQLQISAYSPAAEKPVQWQDAPSQEQSQQLSSAPASAGVGDAPLALATKRHARLHGTASAASTKYVTHGGTGAAAASAAAAALVNPAAAGAARAFPTDRTRVDDGAELRDGLAGSELDNDGLPPGLDRRRAAEAWALHQDDPERHSAQLLAAQFGVDAELLVSALKYTSYRIEADPSLPPGAR